MLPRSLRTSVFLVQLVSVLTLMRSIAFDRWITVLAASVLLLGAAAAKRGRAWGVALMFAQAAAFPVAFLIGIAPPWFCLVGIVGALPFLLTSGAFARFDKTATRLLAALAVSGGAIGAVAWKHYAWSVFQAMPSLLPSTRPHHGFIVAAVAALAVSLAVRRRAGEREEEREAEHEAGARVRVGLPVRVAGATSLAEEAERELEEELNGSARSRRLGRS